MRYCSVRKGFTLFELLAALFILGIVAAIALPSVTAWLESQRLQEGCDLVRASWAKARAVAMDEGQSYRFQILPDGRTFRVAPNLLQYWPEFANQVNVPDEADPEDGDFWHQDYPMPKGISFGQANDQVGMGAASESAFLFMPDGSAKLLDSDGVEATHAYVLISDDVRERRRKLNLRALTCVVTQSGEKE